MKYNVSLEDIFEAYYDCRKHKRNKLGAMRFEVDLESNLIRLWHDLRDGTYRISPSTVFIVDKPVKREIFAADFRDRIVHHLLLMYINPLFERHFIYDSYSCRVGKGTHFAVKRVSHFIRSCSRNGDKPCWILKLDISGFFMSIGKRILFDKLMSFIDDFYQNENIEFVKYLVRTILVNDPTAGCLYHSPKEKWSSLAFGKSLFDTDKAHGLPIGNYTSQVFANFYLSELDHFIKHELGIKYYGRYVDDMVIVSESKAQLCRLIPEINKFLQTRLELHLQPKKIYLQPACHGVRFLGCFIHPSHIVTNPRTIRNFRASIKRHNAVAEDHKPDKRERTAFISSVNSYLGIMKHYKTLGVRTRVLQENVNPNWWKHVAVYGKTEKIGIIK